MTTLARPAPPKPSPRWPEEVRGRLDALYDALSFPTPTTLRFADGPTIEVEGTPDRPLPDRLVDALWPILYEQCYSRIYRASEPAVILKPSQPDREFQAQLSAAHASRTRWNLGWVVEWVGDNGSIRARKAETFRFAPPGQYAFGADPTRPPRPGEFVDLLLLRESFVSQPGFYFAHGETPGCEFDAARMTRIYFHANADGMPRILGSLGTLLNRQGVPFVLKCRDDPAHYDRTDAAVLFVSTRFLTIVLRLLEEMNEMLASHLRPGTPLFTKELRPGLGFADNPGTSESFGYSRCVLMARGIVDAHLAGQQGREARNRLVADHFVQARLDLERPHLGPGLTDPYHWPEGRPWTSAIIASNSTTGSHEHSPFLEAADRIGRRLCRDALWAGDRCNWMTWTTEPIANRSVLVYRTAPPGLTEGLAGIALFLANLQRFNGDRQQQITLDGAIRQLRSTAPLLKDQGYERGRLGVGYALISIGEIVDDERLMREGIELMRVEPEVGNYLESARAIAPLIDASRRRDRPDLNDLAQAHGRNLMKMGFEASGNPSDLTTIACALLELDQVSPDSGLRLAATEFLRNHEAAKEGVVTVVPHSILNNITGCEYLRILELLGKEPPITIDLGDVIPAALNSLRSFEASDLSLGRGLTGIADFLMQVNESWNRPDLKQAAESFGYAAIDRFDRPPMPWPCGVPNAGETPDLMCGLAGIGQFFLRLHAPELIPSSLIGRQRLG